MKKKKIKIRLPKNPIIFTGLWITPPIAIVYLWLFVYTKYGHIELKQILTGLCIGLSLSAVIFVKNIYDMLRYGKKEFHLSNMIMTPEYKLKLQKQKALYPPVPGMYTTPDPTGYLLGFTKKNKYVRLDPEAPLNNLVIGPPGAGKSVTLLGTLINNFKSANPAFQVVAIDVKGELNEKSVRKGHEKVKIINPTVKNSTGWDPYYNLNPKSSQMKIEEEIQLITNCLIKEDNEKNKYFTDNARDLLTGFLTYYYEAEHLDFCSTIELIVRSSTNELLETLKPILTEEKPNLIAARYLGKFYGKKGNSIGDVDTTMRQTLTLFSKPSVIYSFRDNKEKASPKSLDDGLSIFIAIPQKKLEMYGPYFRLLVSQMLYHLQDRPENAKPLLFLLDELPTMGKIDQLTQALATLRSRKVSIWCIVQSLAQLSSIYGDKDAITIKDTCQVKTVLNCDDLETAKGITEMMGTFYMTKQSANVGSLLNGGSGTTNESLEKQQIIEPSDLTTLKNMGEVALLLDGTYIRVNKLKYYEDPILKPKSIEIKKYNDVCKQGENPEDNEVTEKDIKQTELPVTKKEEEKRETPQPPKQTKPAEPLFNSKESMAEKGEKHSLALSLKKEKNKRMILGKGTATTKDGKKETVIRKPMNKTDIEEIAAISEQSRLVLTKEVYDKKQEQIEKERLKESQNKATEAPLPVTSTEPRKRRGLNFGPNAASMRRLRGY